MPLKDRIEWTYGWINERIDVDGIIAFLRRKEVPASSATLWDVGLNHFWHAPSEKHGGDLVFFQGHSAPGVYSRARHVDGGQDY
jgi:hypothetical protein